MRFRIALMIALALTACSKPSSTDSAAISALLDLHNEERSAVSISDLVWSEDLAAQAKAWASKCQFEHSHGSTGENLYVTSRTLVTDSDAFSDASQSWAEEKTDYTYSSNTCANGAVCGHYTQIVWKNTKRVGCAAVSCPQGITSFRAGTIVVCEYDPPGNYRGQKPY